MNGRMGPHSHDHTLIVSTMQLCDVSTLGSLTNPLFLTELITCFLIIDGMVIKIRKICNFQIALSELQTFFNLMEACNTV